MRAVAIAPEEEFATIPLEHAIVSWATMALNANIRLCLDKQQTFSCSLCLPRHLLYSPHIISHLCRDALVKRS